MQNKDILYEVYWEDEDGNGFYQGCKTKSEVITLLKNVSDLIMLCNPRIISTIGDRVIPVDEFMEA